MDMSSVIQMYFRITLLNKDKVLISSYFGKQVLGIYLEVLPLATGQDLYLAMTLCCHEGIQLCINA